MVLGPQNTNRDGGGVRVGVGGGVVLGGDFVLRGPNPFLKSYQSVMCLASHG